MIKENELRLGNWFSYDEIKEQVYDIFFDMEEGVRFINDYNADFISPIPLTPEILGKAGFVEWHPYPVKEDANGIKYFEYTINGITYKTANLIQHLHQLQNLYFALTGEELKVNLNVEVTN